MQACFHGQFALLLMAIVMGIFLVGWAREKNICCRKFTMFVGYVVSLLAFLLIVCLTVTTLNLCAGQCPLTGGADKAPVEKVEAK